MSTPTKATCPACAKSLKIIQTLPARVRCPKCNARLAISGDGKTELLRETAPIKVGQPAFPPMPAAMEEMEETQRASPWLVPGLIGGGVLLAGLAIWLVAANLGGGTPKEEENQVVVVAPDDPKGASPYVSTVAEGKGGPLPAGMVVVLAKSQEGFTETPAKSSRPVFVARDGEGHPGVDQAKVNAAIDKGVEYLKKSVENSTYTHARALVGLTLLSCGLPPDDPRVQTLAKSVRSVAPTLNQTYELATHVWFLDKLGQSQDRELIRKIAYRLMHGQKINGGWDYTTQSPGNEQQWIQAVQGQDAKNAFANHPMLRFTANSKLTGFGGGHEDNSLTQFAVLALWAAKKYDVPVEKSLAMVEARFRQCQSPEGSWGYTWRDSSRKDSMTCAGLLGLAVGRGRELDQKQPQKADETTDPAIEKGFTFLAKRLETMAGPTDPEMQRLQREISDMMVVLRTTKDAKQRNEIMKKYQSAFAAFRKANPGKSFRLGGVVNADAWGDLYFLWSLERMAVVYDLRTIGKTDWYAWGANHILTAQKPDGSWSAGHTPAADTCFALLFLRRANVVQDLTVALQGLSVSKDAGERGGAAGQLGQGIEGQGQGSGPVLQGAVKGLQ